MARLRLSYVAIQYVLSDPADHDLRIGVRADNAKSGKRILLARVHSSNRDCLVDID